MASRKRDTRFRPEPRRKTTLLTRLLTRQPKGVRLRARRHASAVPIRSLELSFRGAAERRARNPVTYVSDYWIPGSRPFGPRPGMTTRSESCNASHSGGSPSRRARALSRRENRRTAQLSIASRAKLACRTKHSIGRPELDESEGRGGEKDLRSVTWRQPAWCSRSNRRSGRCCDRCRTCSASTRRPQRSRTGWACRMRAVRHPA